MAVRIALAIVSPVDGEALRAGRNIDGLPIFCAVFHKFGRSHRGEDDLHQAAGDSRQPVRRGKPRTRAKAAQTTHRLALGPNAFLGDDVN
jgi:hypothetical protein